jgi:hypothetical protein
MEQTAVEWLASNFPNIGERIDMETSIEIHAKFQHAERMHEKQIKDAYSHGWHDGQDVIISQVKHIDKGGDDAGEKFYNETFKK